MIPDKQHEEISSNKIFGELSIRSRLIAVLILIVIIPLIITNLVGAVLSIDKIQEQVLSQLSTVADLKATEIHTWIDNVNAQLDLMLPSEESYPDWEAILVSSNENPDPVRQAEANIRLQKGFLQSLERNQSFEEISLLDMNGLVVVSTSDLQEGQIKSSRRYFSEGLKSFFINPPYHSPSLNRLSMVASIPVKDQKDNPIGVLIGRLQFETLYKFTDVKTGLGETGELYLVNKNHILLTPLRFRTVEPLTIPIFSTGINNSLDQGASGSGSYSNYAKSMVLGAYRYIPELEIAIITEEELSETQMTAGTTVIINAFSVLATLIVVIGVALLIARRITQPLERLAISADRIAGGELDTQIVVDQTDEIGKLAQSIAKMTAQLKEFITDLEQRVADRTKEVERRSIQIQVASEVARDTTAVQDLNELLHRAVDLIRERFGFYHAGIFLVDDKREFAILRASTGDAGRQMIERGHKLKVGETGIVGYVTSTGEARIATDVGVDAVHFKNPLLPETRSEMALPLISGNRIIGALDVQSTIESAFDQEDIRILQILADQLAVAIENANLFSTMNDTLSQLEAAQQEYTREAWKRFTESGQARGYMYRGSGVETLGERTERMENTDGRQVIIPLKIRDQVVGNIDLLFEESVSQSDTISTFEEIANRLSLVLESARLLEETRFRSEQIKLLQEITASASSHLDKQELLDDISQKLVDGFEMENCSVMLFDPTNERGTIVANSSIVTKTGLDYSGVKLPVTGCAAFVNLIHDQKSAVIYNALEDGRVQELEPFLAARGTITLILTPLILRGEVVGAILLESTNAEKRITNDDLQLLDQIGLQVSVGLDVARLFEMTEDRVRQEKMLAEISNRMRETLDVDHVIRTAAREVRQALALNEVVIRLDPAGNQPGSGDKKSIETSGEINQGQV
ncbi:MAG: GAF domain-containing protein [Chloroflexi bacterium]|nr:MAG: GAF domain-containing protein [Chloroflexota bacterium]